MSARGTTERIVARPGPSFAARDLRARPRGRIAGTSGALMQEDRARIAAQFGADTSIVGAGPDHIAVDADACSLDGAALSSNEGWSSAARGGRLGDVEGAFALAFTDGDGILRLARDPVGHRTLYYAVVDGELVFGSRIAPLLSSFGVPRRIDARSVAAFLSYAYVPGRDTLVERVKEVLPGELVEFDRRTGTLRTSAFWDLPGEEPSFETDESLILGLREELERAVRALLPPGEPVCASLSGGIDSSLVVALARRLHDAPVRTFSITFGAEHRDELAFSSLVAAHCVTEHRIVELPADAIAAHLDDTISRMDKPNGDPLTVPNALLFREMAEHGRIALNGEGGDPCFGGPKNLPMLLAELYGDGNEEEGAEDARQRTYLRAHLKCFDDLSTLLTDDVFRVACTPPLERDLDPWFSDPRWHSFLGKLMAINVRFKGGHHILPKVDALSAPFGVLPRSPLFAKSVVERAFALPSPMKLRGSVEKYALKRAVADLLPAAIVDRPKSGMLVPVEGWFQGALLPLAKSRLLDGLRRHSLFRRPALEQLVSGTMRGLRPRRGVKIWLLVTLESHLRALGFG
jgi:asparagine synthase (glutamine-hydrolysing)